MLWLILLGVTFLLSLGAMAYLKSEFAKASQVPVASGLTGAQTAARILQSAGINDVEIVEAKASSATITIRSTRNWCSRRRTTRAPPPRTSAWRLTNAVTPCNISRNMRRWKSA